MQNRQDTHYRYHIDYCTYSVMNPIVNSSINNRDNIFVITRTIYTYDHSIRYY